MSTGLLLLACGLVALAIAVNPFARSRSKFHSGQRWITRDLYRGDLRALANMVRGRNFDITYSQIDRLKDRGFVRRNFTGAFRVTFKGYLALILRMIVARDRSLPDKVV
jgi:hypothetical protein